MGDGDAGDPYQKHGAMQTDNALPATDFELKARQLIGEGFCVLEGMLDAGTLRHTRVAAMNAVCGLSEEQLEATRSPGTLINSNDHPGLAECIGNSKALAALEAMGFGGSRFWKAVVISKPGPSPRLDWHQDCMWWDDPCAYSGYSPINRQPDGAGMGPHGARMETWR